MCSAEVNGRPHLMCKTRLDELPEGEPVTVTPMRAFPLVKDLVTDLSWNYDVKRRIAPFTPREGATRRYSQAEADRVQEFRKCIECFLCQDVCHVLRDHDRKDAFVGPPFLVRLAALEMHPEDGLDRRAFLKEQAGIGLCNIAISPLKERAIDAYYDPIGRLVPWLCGGRTA